MGANISFYLELPSLPLFPFLFFSPVHFSGRCGASGVLLCVGTATSTTGLLWGLTDPHSQFDDNICVSGSTGLLLLKCKNLLSALLQSRPVFITLRIQFILISLCLRQKRDTGTIGAAYVY